MSNERKLRLIQVAKEFKVGLNTITDFLQKKGIKPTVRPIRWWNRTSMPFWRRNSAGAELPATNGKHPGANLPEAGYDHPRRGTETDARRGAGGNYQKQRHQRQGRTAPAQNSGQNRSFAQAQTGSETGKQTGGRARTGGCGSETAAGTATGRPQNGSGTCLRNGFRSQTRTGSGAQERQHLPPRRADPHGPAGTRHDGRIGIHTGQPPQTQTPE